MFFDKEFIETQIPNLPIYKCLINEDWAVTKMAHVFVMRKHENGNITLGKYWVDLNCLGIRHTLFAYNADETKCMEKYIEKGKVLLQIDYKLAHNIIYAGYHFAAQFDIQPHEDFAITKNILKDDNDDISFIEIEVGGKEGKPHLFVKNENECSDVFSKLMKNPGEGNFYYTVDSSVLSEGDNEGRIEEDNEEEDDNLKDESSSTMNENSKRLDDYEMGDINAYNVQFISNEELQNSDKVLSRHSYEIIIIQVELLLRMLMQSHPVYFFKTDVTERGEYELIENAIAYPEYFSVDDYIQFREHLFVDMPEEMDEHSGHTSMEEKVFQILDEFPDNNLIPLFGLEISISGDYEELFQRVRDRIEEYREDYPIYAIYAALTEMITETDRKKSTYLDLSSELGYLFPQISDWSTYELKAWWLAQVLYYIRQNDIKLAIHYYQLFAEVDINNFLETFVQNELSEMLTKIFLSDDNNSKNFLRIVR